MPWVMPLWHGLVQLLRLAAKEHNDDGNDKATSTKQRQQSNVDNDGNNGDGGDGDGDGDGKGDGNDSAAITNAGDVNDNNGSNLRMAIG
jgi:hypothetical protein